MQLSNAVTYAFPYLFIVRVRVRVRQFLRPLACSVVALPLPLLPYAR